MPLKISLKTFWFRIINNGVHHELDFDQITQIRISNAISIIGALFAFFYCVFLATSSQFRLARNDIFFIANILLLYLFNYLRFYRLGTVFTFITLPVTLLFVNYEYGQIGTEYFFYSTIVLCFYYYRKPINQYLNSVYLIILIILTKYLEQTIPVEPFAAKISNYILLTNILMSSALLFISISLFINEHLNNKIEIEQKNRLLNEALKETQLKNEQVNLILKELNHRVKNNLQMVSSLFNIQSYKTKNKETRNALKAARNRIVSIAILHQKLYKDNLFLEIGLKKYLEELVDYLVQSVSLDNNVHVSCVVEDIKMRIEDTVHIGLIVNEVVTNALKYGVNKVSGGNHLDIRVEQVGGYLQIGIKDSGAGFPNEFSIEKSESFGLDLVYNIVLQHEGKIELINDSGAKVLVKIKMPEFSY